MKNYRNRIKRIQQLLAKRKPGKAPSFSDDDIGFLVFRAERGDKQAQQLLREFEQIEDSLQRITQEKNLESMVETITRTGSEEGQQQLMKLMETLGKARSFAESLPPTPPAPAPPAQ